MDNDPRITSIGHLLRRHSLDEFPQLFNVITSSDDLPPERVRQLSWSLEPGRQHLVVAPSLTDIGGPRIHTRPVQGLPLIHVETPTYSGRKLYTKRAFDLIGSAILLIVLSPVLLVLAILVKATSPGPVFFLQERVGLNGSTFHMVKFRSMVVDAEDRLQELSTLDRAEGNDVLFKMRNDPRVTRIGAFMRRYSLDEVPQLFNVLLGNMSLVGPRPPLAREVERYDVHVHRRFLVKPGDDRAVAGQRTVGPVVGGLGAVGPVLRGELVDCR